MNAEQLKKFIIEVPNFPKPGVGFKDISPLVRDPLAYRFVIKKMLAWAKSKKPEIIVGIESRGYLFAAPIAHALGLGIDVIRKKGKLPRKTVSVRAPNEYAVEYFEMHDDTIKPGQRVVIIDDLIATGSSSIAAIDLVRLLKGNALGFGAAVELAFLNGVPNIRTAHPDVDIFTFIRYE